MPQDNHNNNNRFYSEEAQDILGKLPSWIIRWGMALIFLIFTGIIAGSCFLEYPQVVTGAVSITTINPPSDLIAKTTGRIDTLLCSDGQVISKGDVVAIIYNTAQYSDVCQVDSLIYTTDSLYRELSGEYRMGDLQAVFSELRAYCSDFAHYLSVQDIPRRILLLETQIAKHNEYLRKQEWQRGYIEQDLMLEYRNFQRDSTLYSETIIAALDFERTTQALIQKKNSLASFDASMTSTELTILQMRQQLAELEMQFNNETSQFRRQIAESRSRLQAQIKQWRETYLLTSPICGRLTLTKYWNANQNVNLGDKIATVIPTDSVSVIGIMTVPSAGFGRVAVGQTVNIRLNGYPYQEYGVLKGVVSRLSSVPDRVAMSSEEKIGYIAEVTFPGGMQSTYKEQLKLIQQMDGTGDIITRDQRLIERFIQPLRALFDRAKGN